MIEKLSLEISPKSGISSMNSNTMKSSPFKSSLPPLMLEYRETFKINLDEQPREFLMNKTTYRIDKHGYLMDH